MRAIATTALTAMPTIALVESWDEVAVLAVEGNYLRGELTEPPLVPVEDDLDVVLVVLAPAVSVVVMLISAEAVEADDTAAVAPLTWLTCDSLKIVILIRGRLWRSTDHR
jgi:hypothetical protein